ncbi:MAG: nuclear transport factor 2 family protein [Acidobacteriota bacterium]
MLKRSVFIAVFIVAVCCQAFAQKSDDAAFRSIVKQMLDAQTDFDAAALDKIYTADFIEISPAGEFDPREKVLGFYKPELKPDPAKVNVSVDASDFSIRNYEKTAIVITKLTFNVTADGQQVPPRNMRAMAVFRKENGAWKIASVQYTGIRPAPPKSQGK